MYFLESEDKSYYFVFYFLFFFSLLLNAHLYPQLLCIESLAPRRALVVYLVAPAAKHVNKMCEAEFYGRGKGKFQPMMNNVLNGQHYANEQTNQIVDFLKYPNCDVYYDYTHVLIKLS